MGPLDDPYERAVTYVRIEITGRRDLGRLDRVPRGPVQLGEAPTLPSREESPRAGRDLGIPRIRLTGG